MDGKGRYDDEIWFTHCMLLRLVTLYILALNGFVLLCIRESSSLTIVGVRRWYPAAMNDGFLSAGAILHPPEDVFVSGRDGEGIQSP